MSARGAYADWIAVDWGTSHLRAWAMTGGGDFRAEAVSDNGMLRLSRDGFERALLDLISPWLGAGQMEVLACGMVGSRQGWAEVPYIPAPCKPLEMQPVSVKSADERLRVRIVPGIRQDRPADVMRGEETQIAGYLATHPGFDGILCLPGTHTKWAEVSAGEVVSFRTFMTGELFAMISDQSVLRHSLDEGWDDTAFAESVADALSRPEMLAARLFAIRAEGLLAGLDGGKARARLSGLLIGAELAGSRPYWLGRDVAIVGAAELGRIYRDALRGQGLEAAIADGGEMTRAGLASIHANQKVHAK